MSSINPTRTGAALSRVMRIDYWKRMRQVQDPSYISTRTKEMNPFLISLVNEIEEYKKRAFFME